MNPLLALSLSILSLSLVLGLPQDSELIALKTKDGRSVNAQVLGIADGKVQLKVFGFGGEATLKRRLDEFVPESVFLIELRASNPKNFEQHFALAKRAAELDLLPQAGAQARAAVKASAAEPESEAKKQQLHAWAADALEKMIGDCVAVNDCERAGDCLELLTTRLPEQRSEEQLSKLAEQVNVIRERNAAKRSAERTAKLEAKKKAEIEKSLEPIHAKRAQGDKFLNQAISQSKNTASSARSCDSAVDAYKAAWKLAQELAKQYPDDAELQQELASMIDHLEQSALRAALHAANVLILQSDFKGATDWVSRILKYDPNNADAKELLTTIQLASTDGDSYRYGWRRRR